MTTYESIKFLDAVKNRRSIYSLNKTSPISDSRIQKIVHDALEHVPSTFNSQSTRLVILFGDEHDKFWDVVADILKALVPAEKWESTSKRMAMFRGAYGTILFYEDPEITKSLQTRMPDFADKFPDWAEHTSAMHQYMIWTALEAEGLGVNLQHYNPLPDQKVSEIWGVPREWSLKAQIVFGGLQEGSREKLPEKKQTAVEERLRVFGAKA